MDDGVTIGLKLWIIFLVIFVLLGYEAVLSICLGLIAAIAGGYMASQSAAKPRAPKPAPPPQDQRESPLKLAQQRFVSWGKRHQGIEKRAADLLSRTRKKRTLKSRR